MKLKIRKSLELPGRSSGRVKFYNSNANSSENIIDGKFNTFDNKDYLQVKDKIKNYSSLSANINSF